MTTAWDPVLGGTRRAVNVGMDVIIALVVILVIVGGALGILAMRPAARTTGPTPKPMEPESARMDTTKPGESRPLDRA